jgi:hypothetical protein
LYRQPPDRKPWPLAEWPDFPIHSNGESDDGDPPRIDLDGSHPQILTGSWLALVKPTYVELYKAETVRFLSRANFGLVSKVTRIELDGREHLSWFQRRQTVVLAHSVESRTGAR